MRQELENITIAKRKFVFERLRDQFTPQHDQIKELLLSIGASSVRRHVLSNMLSAEIPSFAVSMLESDPRISGISLVTEQRLELERSVPALGAPSFWNAGFTGAGESVGFLDSGAFAGHPAFGGRVVTEIFTDGNPTCSIREIIESNAYQSDFNGHGTHVGGIIGSIGTTAFPNRLGVARGVGTLFNLKVSCAEGRSFDDDRISAVEAALSQTSMNILNNSNGGLRGEDYSQSDRNADRFIDLYDLFWANACGNESAPMSVASPGTAYNTVCVANWDSTAGTRSIYSGSSRGPTLGGRFKPDLAAPGTNIMSLDFRNPGFVAKTGTSMASPHVAGAAALIRHAGIRGRLGIKALLLNSTEETGWQPDRGWGYLNLENALRQKENVFAGELSPAVGNFVLLHGSNPISVPFKATVVWNRFVRLGAESFLRDVNLHLYDTTSNALLAESTTRIQNVEQVSVVGAVQNFVLKVSAADSGRGWTEPFAIALTASGFQPAIGPRLSLDCASPRT